MEISYSNIKHLTDIGEIFMDILENAIPVFIRVTDGM